MKKRSLKKTYLVLLLIITIFINNYHIVDAAEYVSVQEYEAEMKRICSQFGKEFDIEYNNAIDVSLIPRYQAEKAYENTYSALKKQKQELLLEEKTNELLCSASDVYDLSSNILPRSVMPIDYSHSLSFTKSCPVADLIIPVNIKLKSTLVGKVDAQYNTFISISKNTLVKTGSANLKSFKVNSSSYKFYNNKTVCQATYDAKIVYEYTDPIVGLRVTYTDDDPITKTFRASWVSE